eukprot:TRINITY_DN8312_c0_g1_i5.p2 TRINITY_DN8312_c0_g1~~TRINITY_DN8312_c0_g1_i5.p2  ORF type:complete len:126 (+),score=15.93 TRINITY_DN8312_c0_g1_i5:171-548(+)
MCIRDRFKEDEILAFHGHQVDYMNSKLWRLSRFLVRYIWKPIENILGFKEPISPSSNHDKGTKIDLLLDKMAKEERKIIICGHTHNDIFEYPKEGLYFNDGCCICLLYTSPSPRDLSTSRMPSSA